LLHQHSSNEDMFINKVGFVTLTWCMTAAVIGFHVGNLPLPLTSCSAVHSVRSVIAWTGGSNEEDEFACE
jgi:hypothetical protein